MPIRCSGIDDVIWLACSGADPPRCYERDFQFRPQLGPSKPEAVLAREFSLHFVCSLLTSGLPFGYFSRTSVLREGVGNFCTEQNDL